MLIEFLKQIPDVIWAAAFASLITFIGVILTNRNSRNQVSEQLEHDAMQRNREREMKLRQDIYIRASEAIARSQNILNRLADLNLSEQEISAEFAVDGAALAKAQVVCTNETVQTISSFQQELASAYLELILKRANLINQKNSIDLLSGFVDKSQTEQDRLLALMKQLNLEGNADQRIWDVVNKNFEFEQVQHAKYSQERRELWNKQNKEHISFAELCFQRFVEVSKLVPPTIFAMRKELELPIDREAYLAGFNQNLDRSIKTLQSFLDDASKMVDSEKIRQ